MVICSRINDFVCRSWNVRTNMKVRPWKRPKTWGDSSYPFLYKYHSVHSYRHRLPWSAPRETRSARWRIDRRTAEEGVLKNWCFPGPSEHGYLSHEWFLEPKVSRPYVIDCSSAASSPDEWDTGTRSEGIEINFLPWILISSDDYTRVITIYK